MTADDHAGTCEDAGFTLVELLVSLALLAVTATLLLAALTTGRGIVRRAEAAAIAAEAVAAAQALLRDRIEAMVPDVIAGGEPPVVDVRGDAAQVSFTAPPALSLRPAPPRRFRLLLSRRGTLALYSIDPLSIRADAAAPGVAGWSAAPLLDGVASLDIGYFGVAPPDNQRRWRSFWQERPGLPELVRIRIGFAASDPRVWPDLLIHPAATVTSACRLDTATGLCQRAAG